MYFANTGGSETLEISWTLFCTNALPVFTLAQVYLGGFLGLSGRSWAAFGRSWGALGRSWALFGRSWAFFGRLLNDFCVELVFRSLLLAILVALGSILGAPEALSGLILNQCSRRFCQLAWLAEFRAKCTASIKMRKIARIASKSEPICSNLLAVRSSLLGIRANLFEISSNSLDI